MKTLMKRLTSLPQRASGSRLFSFRRDARIGAVKDILELTGI